MNETIVTIVGNLGDDPRRHDSSAGSPVTSFRVGCVQRRHDKALDAWVDGPTSWYRVSAFRNLGQHAFESLRKGQRVIVQGKLKLRSWEAGDKQGVSAEIDAEAIGPDLRWGVSEFTPTMGRDAGGRTTAASEGSESAIADGADEWSTVSDGETDAVPESWSSAAAAPAADPVPF